jgi:hypothetical protein
MDQKFLAHVKAFLISHQIGDDPKRNLAKIKVIANTNPDLWDGKLPTAGIRPDADYCKVSEAAESRPILPWWWYAKEHEPVPSVVQDIYKKLAFDFSLVYPQENTYIYVCVEPPVELLPLLARQDQLRAFILISLINKKFSPSQRESRRLRLGTVLGSKDIGRVFPFIAFVENDARYNPALGKIPTITRLVHPASNTANWSVRLPKDSRVYGSLREIVAAS